jgi:hypothetical protein
MLARALGSAVEMIWPFRDIKPGGQKDLAIMKIVSVATTGTVLPWRATPRARPAIAARATIPGNS